MFLFNLLGLTRPDLRDKTTIPELVESPGRNLHIQKGEGVKVIPLYI